ncbi:enoyl-CoA hydratase-related protein [Niveispirillum sp.]|uniref:enoyl-CoA hydratase/isomerase family protein n=1 Tax=Niveispirillum sp. TaxID=1917217 RepID=UPI001B3DDE76|nr:enoyl-CoA hydratase-related protein [Niveispirillum sp.]MBP7336860.1 enoyl-CoA hydratase/isomerase family protein [Niveispirillum sp.]
MTETIRYEVEDGVARIILDNPDAGNAIDQTFADRLLDLAHAAEDDKAVRAVLLTGTGRLFCVGGNVRAFAAASDNLGNFVRKLTASLHMAVARLASLSKPVIVAVNGPAAGAGLGLAILGDVVLAARSASFTVAYPGIGLSPDAGTTFLLPRLVGLRKAQEMLFLAKTLNAEEAVAAGLATMLLEDADLRPQADRIARRLASMPTLALARSKRLLLSSSSRELETQLEREAADIAICSLEPHATEGISAFLEGRKARFA